MSGQASGARERKIRLRLILVSIVVTLLVCEVALRVRGVTFALPPSWSYHPVLGWTQPRGRSFDAEAGGRRFRTSFNRLGFRDDEHTLEKPAGVRRIVVIGDSYCEALQVPLETTFFRQLEARLNARGNERWETINLGVGDFGTTQEWIALTQYGLRYHPDLVILAFLPLNDLCNNSIELYATCLSPNDRYRPYFVEGAGGALALTSAQPVRNFLRSHLYTYALVENALGHLWPPARTDVAQPQRLQALLGDQDPFVTGPFSDEPHAAPLIRRAWHVTDRVVERIAEDAQAGGARLLTVVMPSETQISGHDWPEDLPIDSPERRLTALLQPRGLPVVATSAEFRRQRAAVLPFVDGHPSAAGHHLVAELIYARLLALGWAGR
jgi:hypothetical protein